MSRGTLKSSQQAEGSRESDEEESQGVPMRGKDPYHKVFVALDLQAVAQGSTAG